VEVGATQAGAQLGLVHGELPRLHEIRRVAQVFGRRKARGGVEAVDLDAHAELALGELRNRFERH
jgi:hypothetical protein